LKERRKMPSKPIPSQAPCLTCGNMFMTWRSNVVKGGGVYCSNSCKQRARKTAADILFFRHVGSKTSDGCFLWTARLNNWGYGVFHDDAGDTVSAHRFSHELFLGPIPEGKCVLHRCDHRACIHPVHFFLGTQLDNISDRHQKGRSRCGTSVKTLGYVTLEHERR
jgi:hypothetical protein